MKTQYFKITSDSGNIEPDELTKLAGDYFGTPLQIQFSQQPTEKTETPLRELSSVGAEQAFEEWWSIVTDRQFDKNNPENMRVKIAFLAGSKVKPVNEKDFIKKIKSEVVRYTNECFAADAKNPETIPSVIDFMTNLHTLLSTAPDDGWIPVEKELPKDASTVLIFIDIKGKDNDGSDFTPVRTIGWYSVTQNKWIYELITHSFSTVTHWQPLPKSPR